MLRAAWAMARRTAGSTRAASASMVDRLTSSAPVKLSSRRAYAVSARSPSRRTRSTIACTRRSNTRSRLAEGASRRPIARLSLASKIRIHDHVPAEAGHPSVLQHDLVEWVLDDPLRARRLQTRNQVANRALFDDRVHGDPVRVAERGNRRPLQRRKQLEDAVQIRAADVEHQPDAAVRLDRRF